MLRVNFYELNTIEDSKLLFAVIMAKYNEKWIYVRHKKKEIRGKPLEVIEKRMKILRILLQESYLKKLEQKIFR